MLSVKLTSSDTQPLRILCLGAHSDDIEIGCGGTILSLLARHPRAQVRWEVFSGCADREREARSSAAQFLAEAGERTVATHTFRDGFFPHEGAAIKDAFEAIKRAFTPDVVFTHFRDDRHQDHRVISDLTWNTFRNHLVLEYEIPKYDGDLGQPNLFVPLSEAECSRKVAYLLSSFGSQRTKPWFDNETFLALLRLRGMEANSPTRFAEAFYGRKVNLL